MTVTLILLLFDGGMHIGWRRFRSAAGAVLWIGVVGTLVTAAGVAVLAHLVFGFDWRPALLLGMALAPTDPAVVFSVLGRREIGGRSGTLLEGESGANDPVGIAAMAALLATAGVRRLARRRATGPREFALQMVLGARGRRGRRLRCSRWLMRRVPLPNGALYPLQTLLGAGAIYGAGHRRPRLRLPGRLRRRHPGRRPARAVQGRDRAVPLLAGQPRPRSWRSPCSA